MYVLELNSLSLQWKFTHVASSATIVTGSSDLFGITGRSSRLLKEPPPLDGALIK